MQDQKFHISQLIMDDLQSFKKLRKDNHGCIEIRVLNVFLMVSPQFICNCNNVSVKVVFCSVSFWFSLLTICTKSGKNTFKVLKLNCLKRNPRKCAVLNGLLMVLPPIYCTYCTNVTTISFCIGYFWVSLLRIWAKSNANENSQNFDKSF